MSFARNKYEHMSGFIFSFCAFLIVSVAARVVPVLIRTVLSFFVRMPSTEEICADGSYLFDIVYPLFGIMMLAGYFAAVYWFSFFAASKISYRTLVLPRRFSSALELSLVFFAGLLFDINLFISMEVRGEFWYPSAIIASLTGVVDKTNLLGILSERDMQLNYFTLEGLTQHIMPICIVVTLIMTVAAVFTAYFGRKRGAVKGTENYKADKSAIRDELGVKEKGK